MTIFIPTWVLWAIAGVIAEVVIAGVAFVIFVRLANRATPRRLL